MTSFRMRLFSLAALAALASGCEDNAEMNEAAIEAVTLSASALFNAIESDEAAWLTDLDSGQQVTGTLPGAQGGTLQASGWRLSTQQETPDGFHTLYADRVLMSLDGFAPADASLSGTVLIRRHYLDFGPPGGASISDVSRTTHYYGTVLGGGSLSGSFDIDVHSFASGTLEWTCGTVNSEEYGQGSCY